MFAARLVQLQGIDPGSYAALAAAEGTEDVVLPAARGEITDRNGDPLAASVAGTMIVADPALTADDASALAGFLARRLDVDYAETLERLRTEDSRFQYIARQVPTYRAEDVVSDAEEKGFRGLFTENDPLRTYPNGDVAANVVGFLGTPEEDGSAVALAGLEDSFNAYLSGTDGAARYQMGAGNQIPLGDNTVTPAEDGSDLQTTIDQDLQWYTQQVLQQTVEQSGGESGIAVVMDSRTGQLLSLADYPTYDAADPQESPDDLYKSSALTDVYEPGSVEKALTMAGLLDAGLATPRTRLEVPGQLNREDRPIGDYWEHGTLRLTLAGVLAKSSNIGTVLASDEYGRGQLRRYLSSFGLGKRTGIGLGGETKGILKPVAATTAQEEDRISFGQSLSVNAVQMTAAINAIANGGVRIDPSLILGSARADDGSEIGTDQVTEHRVVSEEAAHQTMLMMERVIDPDAGVAPGAAVPGYRVAGKTGTAQRVGEECGCYDGSTTVSFAGFAPADDPRFTIYVVVHAPSNGGGGGSVAGPAFAKLMSYALRRYGVAPTGTQPIRLPVEW
ncbi:penicillin-binding protein 2 [Nocardioides sp. BGMRC 2183]|nr:penicillin-binding protein 2 [Nocardioides sp. BGMRC 2183]